MQEFKPNDIVRPKTNIALRMVVVRRTGDSIYCKIAGIPDEKVFLAVELEMVPHAKAIPPLRPTFG